MSRELPEYKFDFGDDIIIPFRGLGFRMCDHWGEFVDVRTLNRPLRQLEIGVLHGFNLCMIMGLLLKHPETRATVIDPWEDYDEQTEYRGMNGSNYEVFQANMERMPFRDRVDVRRGYSADVLPTLERGSYDIIQIDGNHAPAQVLEDAVLSWRLLKDGGIMVFDDQTFGGLDVTKRGIDAFLSAYRETIAHVSIIKGQCFLVKKGGNTRIE